jgi:hypothetical protein
VKIRLMGTAGECDLVARRLPQLLASVGEVLEVSDFYPNRRGNSELGRVYVELRLVSEARR